MPHTKFKTFLQQHAAIVKYRREARLAVGRMLADPSVERREVASRAIDRLVIVTRGYTLPRDAVKQATLAAIVQHQPPFRIEIR